MGWGKTFFFRPCGNRVKLLLCRHTMIAAQTGVKGATRAPVSIMKNQSTISTQVQEMITSRTLHLSGISHRFHFLICGWERTGQSAAFPFRISYRDQFCPPLTISSRRCEENPQRRFLLIYIWSGNRLRVPAIADAILPRIISPN